MGIGCHLAQKIQLTKLLIQPLLIEAGNILGSPALPGKLHSFLGVLGNGDHL